MVGKTGFEPATPWSQTRCTTKLCYFPFNGALGRNRTHNLLIRSQALYPVELLAHINGAQGRSRTGTDFKVRRILSPVRLPISPPGLIQLNGDPQATRTPDPLIKSQMLYRLSYERIQYWYNIQNIAVLYYHTRRKKASLRGKKLSFTKSAGAGTNFPFTNPARISTIKSCTLYADPGGRRRGEVHARPMQ